MKEQIKKLISAQMGRVSRAMTKEQRIKNGRKAWATRIANLEKKSK